MSSYAIVDDQSARVQYYGSWEHDTDGLLDAWDNTFSASLAQGAGAVFSFRGTGVAVVGGVLVDNSTGPLPISAFTLDGGQPWRFVPPNSYNDSLTNVLYSSGSLQDGNHTLNFTITGDGSPYIVDYILIAQTEADQALLSSSASTAPPQTIVTTVIQAPTGLPTTTASAKSSVPTGAIVGGVMGGIAVLVSALLAFYFLYWTKRHRDRPYYYTKAQGDLDGEDDKQRIRPYSYPTAAEPRSVSIYSQPDMPDAPPSQVTSSYAYPYDAPLSPSNQQMEQATFYPPRQPSEYSSSISQYSTSSATRSSVLSITNPDRPGAAVTPGTLPPNSSARRKTAEAVQGVRPLSVRQHTDSGYRFEGGSGSGSGSGGSSQTAVEHGELVEELPPVYSES